MNILSGLISGIAKAGLDKLSEMAAQRRDEKIKTERILLKNENRALKEYLKYEKGRKKIEENYNRVAFHDLVSSGVRIGTGGESG